MHGASPFAAPSAASAAVADGVAASQQQQGGRLRGAGGSGSNGAPTPKGQATSTAGNLSHAQRAQQQRGPSSGIPRAPSGPLQGLNPASSQQLQGAGPSGSLAGGGLGSGNYNAGPMAPTGPSLSGAGPSGLASRPSLSPEPAASEKPIQMWDGSINLTWASDSLLHERLGDWQDVVEQEEEGAGSSRRSTAKEANIARRLGFKATARHPHHRAKDLYLGLAEHQETSITGVPLKDIQDVGVQTAAIKYIQGEPVDDTCVVWRMISTIGPRYKVLRKIVRRMCEKLWPAVGEQQPAAAEELEDAAADEAPAAPQAAHKPLRKDVVASEGLVLKQHRDEQDADEDEGPGAPDSPSNITIGDQIEAAKPAVPETPEEQAEAAAAAAQAEADKRQAAMIKDSAVILAVDLKRLNSDEDETAGQPPLTLYLLPHILNPHHKESDREPCFVCLMSSRQYILATTGWARPAPPEKVILKSRAERKAFPPVPVDDMSRAPRHAPGKALPPAPKRLPVRAPSRIRFAHLMPNIQAFNLGLEEQKAFGYDPAYLAAQQQLQLGAGMKRAANGDGSGDGDGAQEDARYKKARPGRLGVPDAAPSGPGAPSPSLGTGTPAETDTCASWMDLDDGEGWPMGGMPPNQTGPGGPPAWQDISRGVVKSLCAYAGEDWAAPYKQVILGQPPLGAHINGAASRGGGFAFNPSPRNDPSPSPWVPSTERIDRDRPVTPYTEYLSRMPPSVRDRAADLAKVLCDGSAEPGPETKPMPNDTYDTSYEQLALLLGPPAISTSQKLTDAAGTMSSGTEAGQADGVAGKQGQASSANGGDGAGESAASAPASSKLVQQDPGPLPAAQQQPQHIGPCDTLQQVLISSPRWSLAQLHQQMHAIRQRPVKEMRLLLLEPVVEQQLEQHLKHRGSVPALRAAGLQVDGRSMFATNFTTAGYDVVLVPIKEQSLRGVVAARQRHLAQAALQPCLIMFTEQWHRWVNGDHGKTFSLDALLPGRMQDALLPGVAVLLDAAAWLHAPAHLLARMALLLRAGRVQHRGSDHQPRWAMYMRAADMDAVLARGSPEAAAVLLDASEGALLGPLQQSHMARHRRSREEPWLVRDAQTFLRKEVCSRRPAPRFVVVAYPDEPGAGSAAAAYSARIAHAAEQYGCLLHGSVQQVVRFLEQCCTTVAHT